MLLFSYFKSINYILYWDEVFGRQLYLFFFFNWKFKTNPIFFLTLWNVTVVVQLSTSRKSYYSKPIISEYSFWKYKLYYKFETIYVYTLYSLYSIPIIYLYSIQYTLYNIYLLLVYCIYILERSIMFFLTYHSDVIVSDVNFSHR